MCSIELYPQSLTLFLIKKKNPCFKKKNPCPQQERTVLACVRGLHETGSHFVAHLGLKLVNTSDSPALTSQEAGKNKLFIKKKKQYIKQSASVL